MCADKETNGVCAVGEIEKIEINELGISYTGDNSTKTIGPYNYTFSKGSIYAITGNNGTGKTTLLKMIMILFRIVTEYLNLVSKVLYIFT